VRALSVEALRELGYTVIHADSGAAAMRMIDEGQDVSLLFTDIVMPGITGRELRVLATARLPHLKVLFTTGYSRNAAIDESVVEAGAQLLHKPFSVEQLAAKVRAALDG
jgi:CheY-like chemotaxis protein